MTVMIVSVLPQSIPALESGTVRAIGGIQKPEKVEGMKIMRNDATSLTVTWNEISDAKGYQVYMKINKGKFKLIKTTKRNSYTVKRLSMGSSYSFKVRAYKRSRGRYVYGKYSNGAKLKLTDYVYLVDMIVPEEGSSSYRYITGADHVQLAGDSTNYGYRGFCPDSWGGSNIIFNLNAKYTKMTFSLGAHYNYWRDTIAIYCDDELRDTILSDENNVTRNVTLDVEDVYKIEFMIAGGIPVFADVKLYY